MKKKLNANEIYSYALYLHKKGKLTNEKRDILFDMLIESSANNKTTKYIYSFIKEIPGVTLDTLVNASIKTRNENLMEALLKTTNGKNKEKLLQAIINLNTKEEGKPISNDSLYNYIVESDKTLPELEVFISALIEYSIKNKNGERLFSLTREGKLKLEEFEELAIKIGHPKTLYLGIVFLKESNKEKLIKALINTQSAMYIYLVAMFMDNPPMNLLEDGIIKCEDPEYMYKFARDIDDTNIEKLVNKIIEYKDIELLEKCMSLSININQKLQIARIIAETLEQKKKIKK